MEPEIPPEGQLARIGNVDIIGKIGDAATASYISTCRSHNCGTRRRALTFAKPTRAAGDRAAMNEHHA